MGGLDDLVTRLSERLEAAERRLNHAWWALSLTSSDADAAEKTAAEKTAAELAYREILADTEAFSELDAARTRPSGDAALDRQVERLYLAALPEQIPDDLRGGMVALSTEVEAAFNAHRGSVDGRAVGDNEIDDVLRLSTDADERRRYWEASKEIGEVVAPRIRELAALRNRAASTLGFTDYRALMLATQEFDPAWLSGMLDEIDGATAAPFAAWKRELDATLSGRFGTNDLRPWHYGDRFFQEAPAEAGVDLDPFLADADLVDLTARTYEDMGIPIDAAIDNSDLLPRDGKSQHAFCIHMDRAGDVRVLSNNQPGERWMGTMLHEFGHAAYDLFHSPDLPWLLREPTHIFATEGVAMLFGRLVHDSDWLVRYAGVPPDDAAAVAAGAAAVRRAGLLVFARWGLVMARFEEALYRDPTDVSLDEHWWDLVESVQLVRRPEGRAAPDWAAKIHLAVAPVYYHNYLLGELFASQVAHHIGGLVGNAEAGPFLRERIFGAGALLRWDRLCESALGEPVSAAAWGRDLAPARA